MVKKKLLPHLLPLLHLPLHLLLTHLHLLPLPTLLHPLPRLLARKNNSVLPNSKKATFGWLFCVRRPVQRGMGGAYFSSSSSNLAIF